MKILFMLFLALPTFANSGIKLEAAFCDIGYSATHCVKSDKKGHTYEQFQMSLKNLKADSCTRTNLSAMAEAKKKGYLEPSVERLKSEIPEVDPSLLFVRHTRDFDEVSLVVRLALGTTVHIGPDSPRRYLEVVSSQDDENSHCHIFSPSQLRDAVNEFIDHYRAYQKVREELSEEEEEIFDVFSSLSNQNEIV